VNGIAGGGGRGLAIIGTMLKPPLIIIGGRKALAGDLLVKPVQNEFQRHRPIK
jgi:predicted NBD/HSP70 family sugar kinase